MESNEEHDFGDSIDKLQRLDFPPTHIQQLVLDELTAPGNNRQVMTWTRLAAKTQFYTPAGVHSAMVDLNGKLESIGFAGRVFFDMTRYNARGMGIVWGDPEDPEVQANLTLRLEESINEEAVAQVKEDPSLWESVGGIRLGFPNFDAGPYPSPKPPVVIAENGKLKGVVSLTEDQKTVIRFLVDQEGYVDEITWNNFRKDKPDAPKKLKGQIEQLNRVMGPFFPDRTFLKSSYFPLGYSMWGEKSVRHNRIRNGLVDFHADRLAEEHAARTLQSRLLNTEANSYVRVTTIRTEEILRIMKLPPIQIHPKFPNLLIVTSEDSPRGPARFDQTSILMEISDAEKEIIGMFGNEGELSLRGYDSKKRDSIRKSYGTVLKRLKSFGYQFREGTGVASRSRLKFFEPVVF